VKKITNKIQDEAFSGYPMY